MTMDGVIFMGEGKKKVLIVATVVKTHIMQFHIPTMKMLHENGWIVEVVARNDYENFEDCSIPYCDRYYNVQFERSPFSRQNIKAYKELKKIIDCGDYDVVHCHTPVGGVLGRLASRKARKNGTKVFYTAHGFHFYKGGPISSWIMWFPVEWICSFMTDVLFTINKEDFNRSKNSMHAKQVEYLPSIGVDTNKLTYCIVDKYEKRQEIDIPMDAFLLISVGELQDRKNHRLVIEALHKLRDKEIYYILVGQGEKKEEYEKLVSEYGLSDNIKLLGYRKDVGELMKASDCCVHPSKREGFGMAPVEAMSCGLPLITSYINGMKDYTEDGVTGCCIDPNSVDEMCDAILKMKNNSQFRQECGNNNILIAREYDISESLKVIKNVYEEV